MAKIKRKRGEEAYDVRLGFVATIWLTTTKTKTQKLGEHSFSLYFVSGDYGGSLTDFVLYICWNGQA